MSVHLQHLHIKEVLIGTLVILMFITVNVADHLQTLTLKTEQVQN